jgi:hypothetical protein
MGALEWATRPKLKESNLTAALDGSDNPKQSVQPYPRDAREGDHLTTKVKKVDERVVAAGKLTSTTQAHDMGHDGVEPPRQEFQSR